MEVIKTQAALSSLRTLADGTLRVIFDLNEITPEVGASIMALRGQFGFLGFATQDVEIEIPAAPKMEGKTPSQRLRAALFRLWEFQKPPQAFELFYIDCMTKIIANVKSKMEPK